MKKVTVHYRRLVDRNLADVDFRRSFEAGLAAQINGTALSASDATRITTSGDGHRMCLLTPHADHRFCFGEIAVFREGDVPVAETDPHGQVTLRTIPLNGNEEAVKGSTYFMAQGPHLAILHHESSTRFLQDYVNWLMRNPLGDLPQDEMLSLQPLIQIGGQAVAVRDVRSLKIRADVDRFQPAAAHVAQDGARMPTSFRRMIDRQTMTGPSLKAILRSVGMTDGSLNALGADDLEDLELELVLRKKEGNKIQPLPDDLIQGVINDGLDRAAEFETQGARRRGEAIVARHPSEVDVHGAYYELNSVRAALWDALGEWTNQGLI